MANTLTTIMPKILARGLKSLRERCSMPQLVNSDYSLEAKMKGATIDIDVPTAVGTRDVAPSSTPVSPTNTTTEKVTITMDQWRQNDPFFLDDQDLVKIDRSKTFLPGKVTEAIRGLCSDVNQDIFAKYKGKLRGVYGYQGTAGTTPFAAVTDATGARKLLNKQLCPKMDRRGVLDFDAEAKALELAAFSDAEKTADAGAVKIEGEIGKKFGIIWFADDEVPTHTAGTIIDGGSNRTMANNETGGSAIGDTTMDMDEGAATTAIGTILLGDIVSFAGHTQTYSIIENLSSAQYSAGVYTAATNAIAKLAIYPALKVAVAEDEVMTVKASHVVNLVFHRDAFAYATRPLVENTVDLSLGSQILSMQDPLSGLIMRLEVSRQHKQVIWEFDILWGAELVRPELAVRVAG